MIVVQYESYRNAENRGIYDRLILILAVLTSSQSALSRLA